MRITRQRSLHRFRCWPASSCGVSFSSGNMILGSAIGGAPLSLLIGTVRRLKSLLWFGLLGDTVWLLLHLYTLWIPYILGASPQYAKMYARVWGRTTKLLPNFG